MISTLRKLGAVLLVCGWTVSASFAAADHGKADHAAGEAAAGHVAGATGEAAGAHEENAGGADAHGHDDHGSSFNPLEIQGQMFWLFLGVFIVAFFILKKFAFGPILAALDEAGQTNAAAAL